MAWPRPRAGRGGNRGRPRGRSGGLELQRRLQRGAKVVAIDNGPLKVGALGHSGIEHRQADAFKFCPEDGKPFDWLFSDLLEEPHHVLLHLVEPWLGRRWCRQFVINLKFGRVDPIALLRELRGADSPLSRFAAEVRIRHLFHDREEFTVVGTVSPSLGR